MIVSPAAAKTNDDNKLDPDACSSENERSRSTRDKEQMGWQVVFL